MKTLLFAILAFNSSYIFGFECTSEQQELSAQLCFERFESNGAINTHPMEIRVGNHQTLSINGGQAACVFLHPGNYMFTIDGCKAYEIECKKWISKEYSFSLGKGDALKRYTQLSVIVATTAFLQPSFCRRSEKAPANKLLHRTATVPPHSRCLQQFIVTFPGESFYGYHRLCWGNGCKQQAFVCRG